MFKIYMFKIKKKEERGKNASVKLCMCVDSQGGQFPTHHQPSLPGRTGDNMCRCKKEKKNG